ncbi:MAG TPA: cation-translocating P-type ATPase [Roseiflexaceae bacterium]|nr:cation-translocating P-type ATPase [Roseiflexaceae bacterium]
MTIALALGAQRMLGRRALIRKLAAVETLGSVTVICSDKTGTLTENRMTVTTLAVAGECIALGGLPAGQRTPPDLTLLLTGSALCNDAVVAQVAEAQIVGDPTEAALLTAAARQGLAKVALEAAWPRVAEAPFDSLRKRMTTIHRLHGRHDPALVDEPLLPEALVDGATYLAFTKGAVDGLLDIATYRWHDGRAEPLTFELRDGLAVANDQLAREGMRVLGLACRPLTTLPDTITADELERNLIFIGMIGMIDPARAEVKAAIATCRTAGIRPGVITGAHPLTALAIAHELGIITDGHVLTGQELDQISDSAFVQRVDETQVFARVSPEHKLRIVQALQAGGQIVAMTGDGVNDAPALKRAEIGIAMGITGTDVSKEAADMVLQDDNFATIVAAVAEGRVIFDNIRKFIKYLMTTNAGELWLMLLAPFLGMPLPLLPIQILWVNLVTDGLPALALSKEPAERHAMQRPPYPPNQHIFARGLGRHILWVGLLMGLLVLAVGYGYWSAGLPQWQTMVFLTITLAQMAHVLAIRSERDSLFAIGLRTNLLLLGAVAVTFGLQLALIYLPFLQGIFRTMPLSLGDLTLALAISSLIFWCVELEKWLARRKEAAMAPTPAGSA